MHVRENTGRSIMCTCGIRQLGKCDMRVGENLFTHPGSLLRLGGCGGRGGCLLGLVTPLGVTPLTGTLLNLCMETYVASEILSRLGVSIT